MRTFCVLSRDSLDTAFPPFYSFYPYYSFFSSLLSPSSHLSSSFNDDIRFAQLNIDKHSNLLRLTRPETTPYSSTSIIVPSLLPCLHPKSPQHSPYSTASDTAIFLYVQPANICRTDPGTAAVRRRILAANDQPNLPRRLFNRFESISASFIHSLGFPYVALPDVLGLTLHEVSSSISKSGMEATLLVEHCHGCDCSKCMILN
jgi:hypothetical protein